MNGLAFGGMAGLRLALGLVAALVLALSAARLWEAGRRAGAAPLLAEASALRAQAARSALEAEGARGQLASRGRFARGPETGNRDPGADRRP